MSIRLRVGARTLAGAVTAIVLALGVATAPSSAQEKEIKVGYMKNPIQDASLDIMEKWAKANNVKLTRIPMAYSVFMEKVTATLTSGADQFDMIWHNDDWGQLWKKWLEPTDDVTRLHTERGVIRDVAYAGMVTRYLVQLDDGGELQVVRLNLETSSAEALEQRGRQVTVGWRPEQTVAVHEETRMEDRSEST